MFHDYDTDHNPSAVPVDGGKPGLKAVYVPVAESPLIVIEMRYRLTFPDDMISRITLSPVTVPLAAAFIVVLASRLMFPVP
jgi:hypothetical protein